MVTVPHRGVAICHDHVTNIDLHTVVTVPSIRKCKNVVYIDFPLAALVEVIITFTVLVSVKATGVRTRSAGLSWHEINFFGPQE